MNRFVRVTSTAMLAIGLAGYLVAQPPTTTTTSGTSHVTTTKVSKTTTAKPAATPHVVTTQSKTAKTGPVTVTTTHVTPAKVTTTTTSTTGLVDVNAASKTELMKLPGIGDAYATRIIAGRPYAMKSQLETRKILPTAVYNNIAAKIIARRK